MYLRKGRFSLYLSTKVFWLRVRSRDMKPTGLFLRAGVEA